MNNTPNIPFYLVDVFAQKPLTGNPLAVVTGTAELSDSLMQQIAREFNQSETTFILPPTRAKAQWRLRSFTPTGAEVVGAGHNALGTWWWLAESGRLELADEKNTFMQEIGQHILPVEVVTENGDLSEIAMMQAPSEFKKPLTEETYIKYLSDALGLNPAEIGIDELSPQVVSTGVAHLLVPVKARSVVSRIQANAQKLAPLLDEVNAQGCYTFCLDPAEPDSTAHARFFNPTVGIREDPATGSAAGPLACYLTEHKVIANGVPVIIEQGYTMGRPSRINVQVSGEQTRLSGKAVTVAVGQLSV